MNALCAKDAAVITLENLAPGTINTWGNKAIDFEAKYKPIKWDRMTIPRDVRDLINIRWSRKIYHPHLPEGLVTFLENGEGFLDDL